MKYKAQQIDGWAGELHEVVVEYRQGWRIVAERLSKAEANIIAFALNAVAEGKQLAVAVVEPDLSAGPYRAVELYDGPTEGVAP